MAKKVILATIVVYADPAEKDGWIYISGFKNLDGHRWNIFDINLNKLPKK